MVILENRPGLPNVPASEITVPEFALVPLRTMQFLIVTFVIGVEPTEPTQRTLGAVVLVFSIVRLRSVPPLFEPSMMTKLAPLSLIMRVTGDRAGNGGSHARRRLDGDGVCETRAAIGLNHDREDFADVLRCGRVDRIQQFENDWARQELVVQVGNCIRQSRVVSSHADGEGAGRYWPESRSCSALSAGWTRLAD